MDDKLNGVADSAELAADEGALQPDLVTEGGGDDAPKKPLRLDYAQTFKVGFAFAIIMIFWTAYDFVVPLLLEHAYGLDNTIRGLIMGLDNLLSLFMLPLFGKLSDNAHGRLVRKFGRRTPFIVIGTLASVVLMIFVPISTLGQQEKAMNIEAKFTAQLNDDDFMSERLEYFWNSNDLNYCDKNYVLGEHLNAGQGITAEEYLEIRYNGVAKNPLNYLP